MDERMGGRANGRTDVVLPPQPPYAVDNSSRSHVSIKKLKEREKGEERKIVERGERKESKSEREEVKE